MQTKPDIRHADLSASELLHIVMEGAASSFLLIDPNGFVTYLNPAAQKLTGYAIEDARGKTIHELIHHTYPDGSPYPAEECPINLNFQNQGALHQYEETFFRKDGSPFLALCSYTPIVKNEAFLGVVAEIRDITTERKAQEALRLSEERYSLVVQGSDDGLWDWDHATDLIYWNDRCYDQLGLPRQPSITVDFFRSLIHPEDREQVAEALKRHIRDNLPYEPEFRLRHASGEYRYFQSRGKTLRDAEGHPIRTSGLRSDITERKRAELALQESEERFRSLSDSAPVMIWVSDKDGEIRYWNDTWLRFVGKSLEEQVPWGWKDHLHPDDASICYETYGHALANREAFTTETRVRRHDGEYRWIITTGIPRCAPDGEFQGFAGSCVDIHDRKMAAEAMRGSEARFRRVVESGIIGFVFWDKAGAIVDANDAFLDMVGYTREEMLNGQIDWRCMTPPEFAHLDENAFTEMAVHGRCVPYEKQYIAKDGRRIDILLSVAYYEARQDSGVAYILDITDRKKAERAIQESEERFRLMADASPTMIWMTDAQGRAIYHNTTFLEYTGYTMEKLRAESWDDLVHPDDLANTWRELSTAMEYHFPYRCEHRLKSANGEYRWFMATAAPRFGPDGEFIGYIGSTTDIHDWKMAQQELEAYASRLQQSNRELEQFATIASHDLREPLRKVHYFSQILADMVGSEGDDYARRLQSATTRMQTLIDDLLELSRVNRKGKPFAPVDLDRVISVVLDDLEITIQHSGATVVVNPLTTIDADESQIQQVFQNLLSNALKFHAEDADPVVHITGEKAGDNLFRIRVQDNGIGFKEEYMSRIFEPFERLHGKAQYPGTGMGLTICRKIIERHNGTITAESQPGEGSAFIITLPITQERPTVG